MNTMRVLERIRESGENKRRLERETTQQNGLSEGCNTLFYLFNYLTEFRVFLNNLFDLW